MEAEVCEVKRNPQFDLGAIKIQLKGEDIMQVLMQLLYFPVPVPTYWPTANDLLMLPKMLHFLLPAASDEAAMRAREQLAIIMQANGQESPFYLLQYGSQT